MDGWTFKQMNRTGAVAQKRMEKEGSGRGKGRGRRQVRSKGRRGESQAVLRGIVKPNHPPASTNSGNIVWAEEGDLGPGREREKGGTFTGRSSGQKWRI